jgi:hypothetical protein
LHLSVVESRKEKGEKRGTARKKKRGAIERKRSSAGDREEERRGGEIESERVSGVVRRGAENSAAI